MSDILDIKRLRIIASSPDEDREIMELFFKLMNEKLSLLAKTEGQNGWRTWRDAGHYLKGTAANLGMNRLAKLCAEIGEEPFTEAQCKDWLARHRAEANLVFAELGLALRC